MFVEDAAACLGSRLVCPEEVRVQCHESILRITYLRGYRLCPLVGMLGAHSLGLRFLLGEGICVP